MIQTTEKQVPVFHSVEVCTGVFCAVQYQMPYLGRYINLLTLSSKIHD